MPVAQLSDLPLVGSTEWWNLVERQPRTGPVFNRGDEVPPPPDELSPERRRVLSSQYAP